jgi:hypothetical protein
MSPEAASTSGAGNGTITDIVTLQGHILARQASFPEATGTLSWILSALSISASWTSSPTTSCSGPWASVTASPSWPRRKTRNR